MKVFVDSGVYMDYLKGGVSLRILDSFKELLLAEKFELIFPEITKEEIYRGIPLDHDRYIPKKFFTTEMPTVPAGVEESKSYKEAEKLYSDFREKLEIVRKEALIAISDILRDYIEVLYEKAVEIKEDENILRAAELRKAKNNPPGKPSDPLGDEIVWELIKQKVDDDMVIITHDNDWSYKKDDNIKLHPFLEMEWKKKTKKKINLYTSLSQFIETIEPRKITKKDKDTEKKVFVSPAGFTYTPFNFPLSPISITSSSASPSYPATFVSASPSPSVDFNTGVMFECGRCGNISRKEDLQQGLSGMISCRYCGNSLN